MYLPFTIQMLVKIKSSGLSGSNGFIVLPIALAPEELEILDTDLLQGQSSAAFLEEYPLELMHDSQENLDKHNRCSVDANGDEDDTLLGLAGHEEVDVEEDEGEDRVVEGASLR